MPDHITDDIEIFSDSDRENSDEDKSTEENSDENNSTSKKLSIFKKTCQLVLSDS